MMRKVPVATLADSLSSPTLNALPSEKEAIEMGSDAIMTDALPASSSLALLLY